MPRLALVVLSLAALASALPAQSPGKWPPDSLVNTQVIPRGTPVMQVVGSMRNITSDLGVRCSYCHVGEEGKPLAEYDFGSDDKRAKLVARQMMRMVQEINRRLDTIPERPSPALEVTCGTCHRGVSRPVPLATLLVDVATASGADSAVRAYRALRARHHGSDAYNFGESSLSIAAFRLARASRLDEAFRLLALNEELFPASSRVQVVRGNITLLAGDSAAARAAFREALRRDPANGEAAGRLRDLGERP